MQGIADVRHRGQILLCRVRVGTLAQGHFQLGGGFLEGAGAQVGGSAPQGVGEAFGFGQVPGCQGGVDALRAVGLGADEMAQEGQIGGRLVADPSQGGDDIEAGQLGQARGGG